MSAESLLGTYLRQGRKRSGLSVDAVSSASRIVPQLIRALEVELDGRPLPTLGQRGQVVHATLPDEARP